MHNIEPFMLQSKCLKLSVPSLVFFSPSMLQSTVVCFLSFYFWCWWFFPLLLSSVFPVVSSSLFFFWITWWALLWLMPRGCAFPDSSMRAGAPAQNGSPGASGVNGSPGANGAPGTGFSCSCRLPVQWLPVVVGSRQVIQHMHKEPHLYAAKY